MSATPLLDRLSGVRQTGPVRWLAKCPAHQDRTPSLSIRELDDGRVLVFDFGGCQISDILAAVGLEMTALFAEQLPSIQNHDRPRIEPVRVRSAEPLDWSERAEAIWRRTLPLRGSVGQVYLEHRGCALPPSDSHLRFLAGTDRYPPSLCGAVTDASTGKPISLHFTRLAADGRGKAGTDHDKLLLAGHRKKGGVIRLWPDEAITYGLGIAEGIETALAAAWIYTPMWACVDAGNLAALPVLSGIESLVIFADHDDTGLGAAKLCARRWREAGREVRIRKPKERGLDIADLAAGRAA